MKKKYFVLLMLVIIITGLFAQEGPSISLINNTGNNIRTIFFRCSVKNSAGSTSSIEVEINYDPYLKAGETTSTVLPRPVNVVDKYDIELVYTDGKTFKMNNMSVSANARIALGTGSNTNTQEGPPVTLVNNTGSNISTIFLRCSVKNSSGVTSNIQKEINISPYLKAGETTSTNLMRPLSVVDKYDIEVVYTNGKTLNINNLSVSANARISLGSGSGSDSGGSGGSGSGGSGSGSAGLGGNTTCFICMGTGRINCSICFGTGRTMVGMQYQNCFICYGMGSQTCAACSGRGYYIVTPAPAPSPSPVPGPSPSPGPAAYGDCVSCQGRGWNRELFSTAAQREAGYGYCTQCGGTYLGHTHARCGRCDGSGKMKL
jgi:hypothetical protein